MPAGPARMPPGRRPTASTAQTQTVVLAPVRPPRSVTMEASGQYRGSPPRPGRARSLIVTAFWVGLIASVAAWWFDTPTASVLDFNSGLIEAARISGMVAGYILMIQVLMMSRVGWLDRKISANNLLTAHRDLGFAVLLMVLLHTSLSLVGYARLSEVGIVQEASDMLSTFEDMVSAVLATAILVAVGLLSVRVIRSKLPYELWHFLHLSTYVVLLLSYGHQFALGRDLAAAGPVQWVWAAGYYFVVVSLIWGRFISPLRFNLRHRLRVASVVAESQDVISVYIDGRRLDEIQARAGQFFRWRFLAGGMWWQAHPFSLSAAPNGRWLRLTVKAVGDHTEQLKWLEPGVPVFAEGPSGVFTADQRRRHRALLMAAGSGIAPIRALLEDLPRGTVVIYRASSADDLIFREELDWLAEMRDADVLYVLGGRNDPGPRQLMSPRGLRHIVPDVSRRDVYLCGPEGFVTTSVGVLNRLRVPKKQIHLDPFEF